MNFQFSMIVLKEERRGYSCCKNKDNSDLIKNLAKSRKTKVLENKYEEQYIFSHSKQKEKCSIQKLNAEMERSCRLGQIIANNY